MQVNSINISNPGQIKSQKPSFGAVHPARYFIRELDNTYAQVTDKDMIKLLQRKIVTLLNKEANDRILVLQGKVPKSETAAGKSLRERLVRFFAGNDADYAHRRMACSFYDTRYKENIPYIFTGNSAEDVTNIAKPIGKLKSELHSKINSLRARFGISSEEARRRLPREEEDLYNAQSNYYRTLYRIVKEEVKPEKPANSYFDAYFEPVRVKRKTDYTLLNAEFKHKMI